MGSRLEGHQDVDVAVRPEVVPEHGAEQRELRNPPAAAELLELKVGERNLD
jgi:hypothetical protein